MCIVFSGLRTQGAYVCVCACVCVHVCVCGKIYSSVLKQCLMYFVTGNGYLDTTQKAFVYRRSPRVH